MALIAVGDRAPEISLVNFEGKLFSLEETLQEDKNILLVFLRHLG